MFKSSINPGISNTAISKSLQICNMQELTHEEVQGQKERRRPTCSKLLETVVDSYGNMGGWVFKQGVQN